VNPFASNDEKARKALDASVSHHALAVADREAHRLDPADPGDFDAQKAWARRDAELERDVEIAAGVVEHWRGVVAKFDAEAAFAAKRARHAELDRKAEAGKKREKQIDAKARELAELLKAKAADDAELDRFNREERGDLPFIVDAETRLRRRFETIPAKPATYYTTPRLAWLDANGNEVQREIYDRAGMLMRNAAAIKQVERFDECTPAQPERVVPLPFDRFADAIRLIDADGKQIWPPR